MSKLTESSGYQTIEQWLVSKKHAPFDFQLKTWEKFSRGYSGLVVAPTGFGKTFSVFLASVIDAINHDRIAPISKAKKRSKKRGLQLLWISPLRSLATDLQIAMQSAIDELELDWRVEIRNGDTVQKIKQRQLRNMPEVLIITPETLHLLIAQKKAHELLSGLTTIAIDEWHELLGNKRGVMTELALSYLNTINPKVRVWGISATIANLPEAQEVLLYSKSPGSSRSDSKNKTVCVTTKLKKQLDIEIIMPNCALELPWAGHLGGALANDIHQIITDSKTTLIFTNTRKQSEHWYQLLLESDPSLAGLIAIHHGSIDKDLRLWIEESTSAGKLKAVVCTSSLDLGVDFKPVDSVIQIGSTKGIARLIQRAGRSGHSPHQKSVLYLVPTHALELVEMSALKTAYKEAIKTHSHTQKSHSSLQAIESRKPVELCMDVLVQYMITRALGDGFEVEELYREVKNTFAFRKLTDHEWQWVLRFITQGGDSLKAYEQYHKVIVDEQGMYRVTDNRIAMVHRFNIGSIVSDTMMQVKFISGGFIGMVEESFISRLKKGDKFILAGRVLQLAMIKDMTALVKKSSGKAVAPSWLGGRLPLSSQISHYIRSTWNDLQQNFNQDISNTDSINRRKHHDSVYQKLKPLLAIQAHRSVIPKQNELLVEKIKTRDGYHLFIYPFEGRAVHEVMAALLAFRLSKATPISFTMAMNDYGFELLSDQPIAVDESNLSTLLSLENLKEDINQSINSTEMAMRKFRDIAVIAGLVIQNYPRQQKTFRGIQASAGIIFNVFSDFEPEHPLLKQAYTEVFEEDIAFHRLQQCLERIAIMESVITESTQFTPLSFPIKVDSLRMSLTSEDLAKRIERMQIASSRDWSKQKNKASVFEVEI